jgi:GTPase SAR1 family protein
MNGNPFILPPPDSSTHGPLCPWRVSEHLSYYVPVDNTEAAFRSFETELTSWHGNVTRRTVLIYGDDGCGKTSLANRCAYAVKMTAQSKNSSLKLHIVPLPSANGPSARTAEQKAHHALQSLIDSIIYSPNFLVETDIKYIKEAQSDATLVAQRLEAKLSQSECALVVIQPGLEIPRELDFFVELFRRTNIVLVLETESREVYEHSTKKYGPEADTPILRLDVGRLNEDDCINYVQERLKMLNGPHVDIPKKVIQQFTNARARGTVGLSIREFERVCAFLFAKAINRPNRKVRFEDIGEYYISNR